MCPHCGYNLSAEKPIEDGPFRYEPGTGFLIDGERMDCDPQCHELVGAIMQAAGRPITADVLADRLGYTGEQPRVLVASRLSHARRRVLEAGHVFPVETLHRVGLRWNRDAKPHANCVSRHGATLPARKRRPAARTALEAC